MNNGDRDAKTLRAARLGLVFTALSLIAACSSPGCSGGTVSSGLSSRGRTTPKSLGGQVLTVPKRRPPWYRDISSAKTAPESERVMAWLSKQGGGWGHGRFQIDFSMHILTAKAGTPLTPFVPSEDHYTPDCDRNAVPLPVGGAVEGETGYACTGDGDCHLLVYDPAKMLLYEMWRAKLRDKRLFGGCLAVWDLKRAYGPSGRGLGCTSADAAGLPITPLLARPDEVASGKIRHALRFILPNARIRGRVYVSPATHSTYATRGGVLAPPYGARFRLRADYPVGKLPTKGAKVIARALQRYGMFLADGGAITLTVESDRFHDAKWEGILGPQDLRVLKVRDFDLVGHGALMNYDGDCRRSP